LPAADEVEAARAVTEQLTLRNLMDRLHDADPAVAEAAVEILVQRGFSTVEIDVARRIASPSVTERQQLVEDLPRIPGIDARPWLFWLAVDERADVRWAAMTLLATTADPATRARVRELAARDRDRRIIALSERLTASR
jgi:hypothetical protein